MVVLIGAVVVVGVLCLIDLLLTFGVIRRLREHTAMLARFQSGGDRVTGMTAGGTPEAFTATDSEGAVMQGPPGLSVVAFFSASCSVCPKRVPAFVDYVREHPVGRNGVLAVVVAQASDSVPYLADLAEVARVCAELPDGPIGQAFAVQAFPAFFVLDAGGTVRGSSYDPAALPAPVAV
jgi:hypothetical protein